MCDRCATATNIIIALFRNDVTKIEINYLIEFNYKAAFGIERELIQ